MYNATLWYVLVTIVVMEAKNYVVCIVELHATVNNKKNLLQKDALWRIYIASKNKCTYVFMQSASYFSQILTKFEVSYQSFMQSAT
jgi:hypothetical protein